MANSFSRAGLLHCQEKFFGSPRYKPSNLSFTATLLACLDVQPIPTEGQRYKIRYWLPIKVKG
ncbi:MAG: hypothetical protein ACO2PL_19310 [Armatimonadota bacterium]